MVIEKKAKKDLIDRLKQSKIRVDGGNIDELAQNIADVHDRAVDEHRRKEFAMDQKWKDQPLMQPCETWDKSDLNQYMGGRGRLATGRKFFFQGRFDKKR